MTKKTSRRSRQMTDYQSLITRKFHSNRGQHLIKYIESIQSKIAAVENETDQDLLQELEDLAEVRDLNLVSLKFNHDYRIARVQTDEARDLEALSTNHEIKTKSLHTKFLNHLEMQNKKLSSDIRDYIDITNDRASASFLSGFTHVTMGATSGGNVTDSTAAEDDSRDVSTPSEESGEDSGNTTGTTNTELAVPRRKGRKPKGSLLVARMSRETRESRDTTQRDSDSDRFDMLGIVWTDTEKAAISGSERTGRRGRGEDSDHVEGQYGRTRGKESALSGLAPIRPADAMADLQEMRRRF